MRTTPLCLDRMHEVLVAVRSSQGKPTSKTHHINENKLINYAVSERFHQSHTNLALSGVEARALRVVICINTELIFQQKPYKERRDYCRQLFLKLTARHNQPKI